MIDVSILRADARPHLLALLPPVTRRPPNAHVRPSTAPAFWWRFLFVAALGVVGYAGAVTHLVDDLSSGSRTSFLLAVPVLAALAGTGYRTRTGGIGDDETDWIVALIFAACGLTAVALLTLRMPGLSALWHMQNVGMVIWCAACAMVVFGARPVVRMWPAWAFALCGATGLPLLLVAAEFGGSSVVVCLCVAAYGSVAVWLAGRQAGLVPRALANFVYFALSGGLIATYAESHPLATILMIACVVPAVVVAVRERFAPASARNAPATGVTFPRRRQRSHVVLVTSALALACVGLPLTPSSETYSVNANWAAGAGLDELTRFPLVSDYLGDGATMTRYSVPEMGATAVVDVLTAPTAGALHDFADVVWYPHAEPVDVRPTDIGTAAGIPVTAAYDDADAAVTGGEVNWYALSWSWRAGDSFQRVTVLVNQSRTSDAAPPEPQPLSWSDVLFKPAEWIVRQRPRVSVDVDPQVSQRAAAVATALLAVGNPETDGTSTVEAARGR